MRDSDLPSPNIGGQGHHLRRIAAQAISYIEINAPAYGGNHPSSDDLTAFFTECANKAGSSKVGPIKEYTAVSDDATAAAGTGALIATGLGAISNFVAVVTRAGATIPGFTITSTGGNIKVVNGTDTLTAGDIIRFVAAS